MLYILLEGIMGLPVFSNSPEKGVGLVILQVQQWDILLGFFQLVF